MQLGARPRIKLGTCGIVVATWTWRLAPPIPITYTQLSWLSDLLSREERLLLEYRRKTNHHLLLQCVKLFQQKYFQSGPWKSYTNDAGKSILSVEWTNQHGCGGDEDTNPQKQNCHLILQYMCQDDVDSPTGKLTTSNLSPLPPPPTGKILTSHLSIHR